MTPTTSTPDSQTTHADGHLHAEELNAFIDGELSAAESNGIQQHLGVCHVCALRVLSATQLKAATARAGERFAPSPEALARLAAQLNPQRASQQGPQAARESPRARWFRPGGFRWLAWPALAAALVLAVSFAGWRQTAQTNGLAAELLDEHLATLSSGASPQVISTDRHTVKPWFQGRIPFSFNIPETLPPDTALSGADLIYIEGQPAALLLFTIHKHEVSIFVTERGGVLNAMPSTARAGFAIRSANTRDLRIVAVSNVNPGELDRLVASVVQAQ